MSAKLYATYRHDHSTARTYLEQALKLEPTHEDSMKLKASLDELADDAASVAETDDRSIHGSTSLDVVVEMLKIGFIALCRR